MSEKDTDKKKKKAQSLLSLSRTQSTPSIKKECPTMEKEEELTVQVIQGHIKPVIDRLDRLQGSIDRLLDMCLQVELEDSLEGDDSRQ